MSKHSSDKELFNLEGRVAFVSGAAGHLGKGICYALCHAGAHVILNGQNSLKIQNLAAEMTARGYKVSPAICNITNDDELKKTWDQIGSKHDRMDIIVNNAYEGRTGTIETSLIEDFDKAYRVTVTAAFRIVQIALPLLSEAAKHSSGGASVINISSMYGVVSPDPAIYGTSGANNPPFYGAAKAGLVQLTRYLGCHLAPLKIRVNCISPGAFPSAEIKDANPEFHKELCRKTPMARIGHPDELKGPVLFLASDASSYITGINLPVDGGWTAW